MGYSNEDLESIIKYFRRGSGNYVWLHNKYVTIHYTYEDFKFKRPDNSRTLVHREVSRALTSNQ